MVARVTSFEQTSGNEAFVDSARARIEAAVFEIGDLEFVYSPPDSRDDLFPLEGTLTGSEGVFVLSAVAESALGASVLFGGTLDLTGDEPLLRFSIETTSTGATTSYDVEVVLTQR